jgi:dipeptidyl aminopeptidase/acylaminoacyl peptidase
VRNADISGERRRMTFRASDPMHLDDVYVADLDGQNERRLTSLNAKLAARTLSPSERFTFKGADNWEIEAFLTKPAGWKEGERYPLILKVHGGPNGMSGYDWDFDTQGFAGAGYAVLRINPRGSSGYGEAFQRAVENEWGGKAYVDLMNGVDVALQKYPWIDASRMGVTGHSYGGFMTNWIVGHTTRFKAATTLAGISNMVSVSGTRDAAYNHRRDFGGILFDRVDAYWNTSPLKYAAQIRTPTLVLHGEQDNRVPLSQGEEFFRALKLYDVPSALVIFPRASHGFRTSAEPRQVVEILDWQLYWFDRYVRGNAAAVPPIERVEKP